MADICCSATENYLLKNDAWKYDIIPEIQDGKNVADFIDPDIVARLEELEAEEDRLEAAGFYDSEEEDVRMTLCGLRRAHSLIMSFSRTRTTTRSARPPRRSATRRRSSVSTTR